MNTCTHTTIAGLALCIFNAKPEDITTDTINANCDEGRVGVLFHVPNAEKADIKPYVGLGSQAPFVGVFDSKGMWVAESRNKEHRRYHSWAPVTPEVLEGVTSKADALKAKVLGGVNCVKKVVEGAWEGGSSALSKEEEPST